ncbi:MAG: iron ABC transporter permease [Fibrobacteres bacterium]|nr:iron ABC transporter permease [Fibrobacterota bacterium]
MRIKSNTLFQWSFVIIALIILIPFLVMPLLGIVERALFPGGKWMPQLLANVCMSPAMWSAIANSTVIALMAVVFSTVLAMPLAVINAKCTYPLKRLLSGVTLLPLILPPFVGAVGIMRVFGRYGIVNALFGTAPYDWLIEGGMAGVAFVQALHLYPILYLNITAALANADSQLLEAAAVAGAGKRRRFLDITLPLAMPGIAAGAVVVFLWSFTDVGTPLIMGFRDVIASEIFDRTTSVNNDPTGSALVLFVLLITVALMLPARRYLQGDSSGSGSKGLRGTAEISVSKRGALFAIYGGYAVLAVLTLLPHAALIVTAFAGDWFMTALPTEYTTKFFGELMTESGVMSSVRNSLFYSGASATLDIVIGFGLAYAVSRKKLPFAGLWDALVMLPLVLPGLVLAFGYLAAFSGTPLDPLKNPVPLLIAGYTIRRLPFVFRSSYASLQQVGPSYEEAARVCGAGTVRSIWDVTLPLTAAGLIGGGILAFLFAMLEVSESLILAAKESFYPITKQLIMLMQKVPDGETVAAALGVLCMVGMAAGLILASLLLGKQMGRLFRM